MNSVNWKCKYCGVRAFVVRVMVGRRVRCPACSEFSVVRPSILKLKGMHKSPNGQNHPGRPITEDQVKPDRDHSNSDSSGQF